jgi:hypothetical protein
VQRDKFFAVDLQEIPRDCKVRLATIYGGKREQTGVSRHVNSQASNGSGPTSSSELSFAIDPTDK